MTQERLGTLVGLSRTSITNIEKGRQHVSLQQLYRIAEVLEIAPDVLLPPRPEKGLSRLARKFPQDADPRFAQWFDTLPTS